MEDLRVEFEKLLSRIDNSGLPDKSKLELRVNAREMCLKIYQDNISNAEWWKKMYKILLDKEHKEKPIQQIEEKVVLEDVDLPPV